MDCSDPESVDPLALKLGIQSQPLPILFRDPQRLISKILDWANHGICGRGVLLDMVRYWEAKGTPVDPWTSHAITSKELEECAKAQGVAFRRGDILLLRVGFIRKYSESGREERDRLADLGVQSSELCASFRPVPAHFDVLPASV